jgi:hypothetical protein
MTNSNGIEPSRYPDHQAVWESLPWYVNGTLGGPELEHVDRHVKSCVACRAELKYLRELGGILHTAEELPLAPAQGLSAVMARIDASESREAPRTETPWLIQRMRIWLEPFRMASPAIRVALVAQIAAIVLLLGVVARPTAEAPPAIYRTLSDPATSQVDLGARLHVVFAPQTPAERIHELLGSVQGEIIAGPTALGVYTVATPVADQAFLAELGAQPEIVFAELAVR